MTIYHGHVVLATNFYSVFRLEILKFHETRAKFLKNPFQRYNLELTPFFGTKDFLQQK